MLKGSNLKNKLSQYFTSIFFNKCIGDFMIDFFKNIIHYSLKSDYSLFIYFFLLFIKKIGLFIIFRPSLFTIHYFLGSLFTIHYKKWPLFTNYYTPSRPSFRLTNLIDMESLNPWDSGTYPIRINPFMPNVFSHPYQLDESISNFGGDGWYFTFLFKF